jgi:hypothetical protein
MKFDASHPRINKYFDCYKGDPVQTVVLHWQKQKAVNKLTADTTLDGVEVPVQIAYSFAGVCSGYSMEAIIPLSESIPANSTRLVSLRLKELLQLERTRRGGRSGLLDLPSLDLPLLGSIETWPRKSISFRTDRSSVIKPEVFVLGSPTEVGADAQ